jgi:hypothetical protein
VDTLNVIGSTIMSVKKEYDKFTVDFYHDFGTDRLPNLRKYTIDEAMNDSYFMDEIIPQYINRLHKWESASESLFFLELKYDFRDRIKLIDTIMKKMHHNIGKEMYVSKVLNDFFGIRIILSDVIQNRNEICRLLDNDRDKKIISRFYLRNDGNYHAIHCYFQDRNTHLPWELQIWDESRKKVNYSEHVRHERERNN